MGDDYWPYGKATWRHAETFCVITSSRDSKLLFAPEELFVPEVMESFRSERRYGGADPPANRSGNG